MSGRATLMIARSIAATENICRLPGPSATHGDSHVPRGSTVSAERAQRQRAQRAARASSVTNGLSPADFLFGSHLIPAKLCCRAQMWIAGARELCATSRAEDGMALPCPRMANDSLPGEQPGKLEALLERWQTSLDLHARYAALDDARYWHVQPWPKHERPQRWIIQLARKRILALKRVVVQRLAEGDADFIEGIETMAFLASLVGLTSVGTHHSARHA